LESEKKTIYHGAIYIRLSKEDREKGESNSIANQRTLLKAFLKSKPEIILCGEWVDDGYSGVNFQRPGVQGLLGKVKAGEIDCIVVKDLSRFGRNYIETGRYMEQMFPFLGVRFIAVNDGYDSTEKGDQWNKMLIPFKNLINDAYSRDISIKVRSQLQARYQQGDYVGSFPAYGYIRSEADKHKLLIDYPAAAVVQAIFRKRIGGWGCRRIAGWLNEEGILSPLEYKKQQGLAYFTPFQQNSQARWSAQSVARILKSELYTGTMVQGKESSPNYKIKKKKKIPSSQWIRVADTHEAIITKEDFELTSRILAMDTRTSPEHSEICLFSGFLKCADCGKNMIRRPVKTKESCRHYYICRIRKEDCSKCQNRCRISETKIYDCVETVFEKLLMAGEMNGWEILKKRKDNDSNFLSLNRTLLAVLVETILIKEENERKEVRINFSCQDFFCEDSASRC
jgi:site-specific DNA recombinase